jgi:hypothetical protein
MSLLRAILNFGPRSQTRVFTTRENCREIKNEDSPQQATEYQKEDSSEPAQSKLRGISPKEIKEESSLGRIELDSRDPLARSA